MDVAITARHCTVPESIRRRAEERLTFLLRNERRLLRAEVIFETDHGVKHVEARLFMAGGPAIVAEGRDRGYRAALDHMLDRVGRQIRRQRDRLRDHQSIKAPELNVPAGGT